VRWLHGVDGNQGTDKLIRAALAALGLHPLRGTIARAAATLPGDAQMDLPTVDTPLSHPPAPPRGESGIGGQTDVPPMPPELPSPGAENVGLKAALERAQRGARWLESRQNASIADTATDGERGGCGPQKSSPPARRDRCHVRLELPDGTAIPADERPAHWWEPRPEEETP
jgi:hypothetical protein